MGCGGEEVDKPDTGDEADTDTDSDVDDAGEPTGTDADGDGVTVEDGDCDDDDASTYPGADEILDDGIDQDCSDHDAITCEGDTSYADAEHCAVVTGSLSVEGTDRPRIASHAAGSSR